MPAEVTSAAPRQNYFPALDGLRGLAFLMVFGSHYGVVPWGFAGVDAFFVLSGFLITGIVFDTRNIAHSARIFYIRRSLRIFPLYYGLMIVLLLSYPLFHWKFGWAWLVWPAYVGNYVRWLSPVPGSPLQLLADAELQSKIHSGATLHLGHFWSLCVEEQFYLFWPWVVFFVKDRRKLIYISLLAVVLCPVLRVWLDLKLPDATKQAEVLYRTTPLRVDALLLGGLIALVRRGRNNAKLLLGTHITFPCLSAYIVIWHLLNRPIWHSFQAYGYPSYVFTWGLSFVDLTFGCLLILALEPGSWTYRVLHVYPLRWLGRISFGAYVFHDIFHHKISLFAMTHFGHWKIATAAIALPSTLVVSWASYRWFELPFIRLKDRIAPERVSTFHGELNV